MDYRLIDEQDILPGVRNKDARKRPAAEGTSRNEISISEIGEIILRRRVPVLFCVSLGIFAALLISIGLPPVYEGVTSVSVDNQTPMSSGAELLAQAVGVVDPTLLQTQVNILQTDSLAWDTIKALRLDQKPEALPRRFWIGSVVCRSSENQSADSINPECQQRLVEEFHKNLHVQTVPRTSIISVRYRCKSRYLAAAVANTVASLYIERNFRVRYESATKNSSWLSGQLDGVRKDAEDAARRLINHEEQTGAVGIDGGPNLVLSRLTGLSGQLISAEADRMGKEARYRTALSGDPEALIGNTQTLQFLHAQEAALQNQYAELNSQFGDAYPKVKQIKEQLAKAQDALKAEESNTASKLKSEYDAAVKSEDLLRSEVEEQKRLVYNSTDAWVAMSMLNRDMEASGELYKLVSKRLRTGGILAASNGPDITILDESPVPYQKVSSHTTANIASGIIIGLILGLILSVLLEGFDKRIATMRAVSELCPVPGVGVIPCIQKDGEDSLANQIDWKSLGVMDELETPGGEVADAFRTVRTTLNHSYAETQPSVILVTSPIHNEGSKSASINLAAAFARINQHVLLVDANLRENTSTRTGNSSAAGGLADALDGKDYHPFCIFPSNYQNLIYLPAGASLFNPPDLLDSARMRELITQWREEYDYVILSLPRLNDQSDAAILSTMVDTVLLTVRSGRGRRKDIQRAMKIISGVGAGLHGAIVTDLRSRSFFARATSWQSHPFTEQRKVYINESL